MRLSLSLATRPFVNRLPHAVLLGTLAVAALGLTAWNIASFVLSRAATQAVESELHDIGLRQEAMTERRSALARGLAGDDLIDLRRRVDAANLAFAAKSLSWSLLLERLKEAMPYDAALVAVHAGASKGHVVLNLETRMRNEDFEYRTIDQLEKSPCFAHVYPTGDHDLGQGEISAMLTLDYDPTCAEATRGEPAAATGRVRRAEGRSRG